ncbi:MAG: hypothetical protein AB9903_09475 [Vulcanimicrobiota bacterium]
MSMRIMPYVNLFGREALEESRLLKIEGDDVLPDDEYGLIEAYCIDPRCDCKIGWITVLARQKGTCVAVMRFRLFPDDSQIRIEYVGTTQSQADKMLELLTAMLKEDTQYFALIKSHYKKTKLEAKRRTKKGRSMQYLHPEDLIIQGINGTSYRDFLSSN